MSVSDRRFFAPVVAVVAGLALAGCPEPAPEVECGDLQSFDLSQCDRGTLGLLYTGGILNTNITWANGSTSTAAIYMVATGGELVNGRPAQSRTLNGTTYYLASRYTENGEERRLAFAGCYAWSTVRITGYVQSCANGAKAGEGTFDARYLDWGQGETEASNVELVGEAKVAQGLAVDVWVEGGFAYVAARTGGLGVFDVSDPAAPELVRTLQEEPDDSWNDAKVVGSTLYVASHKYGVILYDVTDPRAPVRIGKVPADDVDVHTLQIDQATNRLFANSPGPNGEVLVFNIQDPAAPVLRWRVRTAEANLGAGRWPHDSTFFQDRLYVNHWRQGMVAFDVPPEPPGLANPVQRGVDAYAGATSHASQAGSIGGRTVLFEGSEGWGARLRVVDFTDPSAPALLGEWSPQHPEISIHNMALMGTKLYVAHYQSGLRILDVSDAQQPAQTAYYNTWRPYDPGRGRSFYDGAVGVRVPGDGHIYVAEAARGLMILKETGP